MGKNTKPILSVLVDEDKKEKFAELARRYKQSMGWILNDCIDRMLAADSMDVYRGSISIEETPRLSIPNEVSRGLSVESIDEMVKASIEKHLADVSGYLPIETVECMAIGAIDKHLEKLGTTSIGIHEVQKLVNESIEVALEPIEAEVAELKKPLAELARRLDDERVIAPDSNAQAHPLGVVAYSGSKTIAIATPIPKKNHPPESPQNPRRITPPLKLQHPPISARMGSQNQTANPIGLQLIIDASIAC